LCVIAYPYKAAIESKSYVFVPFMVNSTPKKGRRSFSGLVRARKSRRNFTAANSQFFATNAKSSELMGCGAVGGTIAHTSAINPPERNQARVHRHVQQYPRSGIVRVVQITKMSQVQDIIDSKTVTDDGNVCLIFSAYFLIPLATRPQSTLTSILQHGR
jgi:hypothetical protein